MALTPATVKILVWVFCALYLAFKIPWTVVLLRSLPEAQASAPLGIAYLGAHILLPVLALATVTFPDVSSIRTACILLAIILVLTLFAIAWFLSGMGYPIRASEFAVRLIDAVMMIICFLVAVEFKLLR